MKWTPELREKARELHARGYTDLQMAEYFGIHRPRMQSYRSSVLKVPANAARVQPYPCDRCERRFANAAQQRRHARRSHGVLYQRTVTLREDRTSPTRRLRSVPTIERLYPRGGNFDSSRALSLLADLWSSRGAA